MMLVVAFGVQNQSFIRRILFRVTLFFVIFNYSNVTLIQPNPTLMRGLDHK